MHEKQNEGNTLNRIRKFHHFYSSVYPLFERPLIDLGVSHSEGRMLFALYEHNPCTASHLSQILKMDKSDCSRIISKFKKNGYLEQYAFEKDHRKTILQLTDKGLELSQKLINASNTQINQFTASLTSTELHELYCALGIAQHHLEKAASFLIRPFNQTDLPFVINQQIKLYEAEYGFSSVAWSNYIRQGVELLIKQFDDKKDCIYILEYHHSPAGCIAVTHTKTNEAQLRFFFIEQHARGFKMGSRLIERALLFCKSKGYHKVFLWTFSELLAARYLYQSFGFSLVATQPNNEWGKPIVEERWELIL